MHWKLSKCSDTRGRENTAVFRGARARRRSTGADLNGDSFSRALLVSCFAVRSSNWRSSLLGLRPWRGWEEAVDPAVQGTALEEGFISCVREAGESVWFCPLVTPDNRMTNDVKPALLVQADIWKHTTPAICSSVAQGNSLLTIRHRAHPVKKADKVCSLAAGRPDRCAHLPSLRAVRWAKPAQSFLLSSILATSLSQELADDLGLMSIMFDPDILEDSIVIQAVHSLRVSPQLLSSSKLAWTTPLCFVLWNSFACWKASKL